MFASVALGQKARGGCSHDTSKKVRRISVCVSVSAGEERAGPLSGLVLEVHGAQFKGRKVS